MGTAPLVPWRCSHHLGRATVDAWEVLQPRWSGSGWPRGQGTCQTPKFPRPPPDLILFHNLQRGQQSEGRGEVGNVQGKWFPSPTHPFPSLLVGHNSEPHGRSQTTLRITCKHLPTTSQATKALRSFWMISQDPRSSNPCR